jgi:hypothetical protein
MAHIRQSRPDSGLGFQVQVLGTMKLFLLRSEEECQEDVLKFVTALHAPYGGSGI